MDKQALFKTGMMGFQKGEVLTYIDELNSSSKAMEKKLEEKIKELEASNEKLGEEITAASEKLTQAQSSLEAEQSKVRELTSQLSKVSLDVAKYKQQQDEKDRELKILGEQNRQLQFKVESAEYKSKKYDDMSRQIGDALIDAKEKAQQVIDNANIQAKGIIHNATATMESCSGQMVYLQEDVVKIRQALADAVEGMNKKLDAVDAMIEKATARVTLSIANMEAPQPSKEEQKKGEKGESFFRDAATQQ